MSDDEFWSATDELRLIYQWARARYVAPWALLLAVLLRVAVSSSPRVMLPGPPAPASLNMAVVLVGRSGAGKGVTDKLARIVWPTDIHEEGLGSGQGIHELFKETKDPADRVTGALFNVSEIDHMAALHAGQANNTRATIKAALTGDRLGSKGATSATTRAVPADSYRLGLSIMAQYGHTGVLLDDVSGGTPQRMVWGSVTDPTIPDAPGPEPDHVLDSNLPPWAVADKLVLIQYGTPEITNYVAAGLLANQRGELDAIDGHRTLTRLKVAAQLAIMDHRMVISELDWELSEHIMLQSDATRAAVLEYDRQAARAKVRDRALSRAVGEQFISDHKLERAKKAILRWLERDGQLARHDLRRKLKADLRDHFDPAVAELAAMGEIAVTKDGNQERYGLDGEGTRVPEVHPQKQQVNDRVPEVHGVPDATVTELDSRRSHDSPPRKPTCSQWFNAYIADLQAAGHTTTTSFAAIEAGMAQRYSKGNIRAAASAHPDVHTIDKKGGTATWSIQRGYRPPVYEGVPEWLDRWLDQQTGDTITPDDAKAAGEAAGHAWHNVRRAAGQSPRIESVPAHGDSRTARVWRIVQATDTEDAS